MSTIIHHLARWAADEPHVAAQRFKKDGEWKSLSAKDYLERIFHLAAFLESRGLGRDEIVAIFSYNNPEWTHLDLGSQLMGSRSAGLYPNSSPKDIQYILNHTEARILGVQNKAYFEKILSESGAVEIPDRVDCIIVFDDDTSISDLAIGYSTALAEGAAYAKEQGMTVETYLDRLDPNAGAFLIYTSGTTGSPKGAVLTHDNLVFAAESISTHWKLPISGHQLFSFLPLCHIAEKLHCQGIAILCRYTISLSLIHISEPTRPY